jgi:hypothetical protein
MGYKGAIYYRIGGYPNPTGEEICYAGTPYAFKIFALKEALDLGFENVLWLDTAVWPLSSTQEVFEQIEKEGFFFDTGNPNPLSMLKTTRKMLENYCDKDLKKSRRVAGWIIGFNRDFKYLERFFNEYSKLVRLGTPFLSVNPEENVLTAILLKLDIPLPKQKKLMMSCTKDNWNYIEARRQGYKFLVRVH